MPYPYNPYLQNPYLSQQTMLPPQPVMPQAQPVNGITQVSGPESAMQFGRNMPPNSTSQALFDSNGKVFYVVSTDGAGMPSLETFDFSPHVQAQPVMTNGDYVSRSEFQTLADKVNQLIGGTNGIDGPVQAATE